MRPVRGYGGPTDPHEPFWNAATKAKVSAVALIGCLFIPDAANLHPNDDTAWTLYLTAKGAANAVMCLLVAWYLPARFRAMACAVAAIYGAGAINAAMNDYLFSGGVWQYPVAALFLLAVWLFSKRSRGEHE